MTDALEVRLLRWGESSQAGRTVTFLLPEEGEHPFRGLKTGKEGELFAIALARIEDPKAKADHIYGGNDGYVDGSGPKDKTPKSEGERARIRAVKLCERADFQDYAFKNWALLLPHPPPKNAIDLAAEYMRARLAIASRRDIAADPEALQRFLRLETSFQYRDMVGR